MSAVSHPARGLIAAIAFATLAPLYARAADIDIYGTQAAAVEIPSIYGTVVPTGGASPGADEAFQAYLDTGTSGIILSAEDTDARNIQAEVVNGQTVKFGDISVGGTVSYNVSEPVDLRLGRYTGESFDTGLPPDPVAYFNQTTANVRMQLSTEPVDPTSFSPPLNLVGMPALKNKVMVVDARLYNHLTGFDENTLDITYDSAITNLKDFPADAVPLPQLQTWVYHKGEPAGPHVNTPLFDPGVPTGQHVVRMSYGDFSGYTQLSPANAIAPTLAHNPFVGPAPFTTASPGDPPPLTLKRLSGATQKTASGSWLFDTGAQISFMSSAMALSLGVQLTFDPTTGDPILTDIATGQAPEGEFSVALGGAGGDAGTLLGFRIGELDIPTLDGYIRLHDIQIGVLDVTVTDAQGHQFTIDGDLGMNTLLPTMDTAAGSITSSQFDFLTFDEQTGLLTLTDTTAVPEPTMLAMIVVAGLFVGRRRRAIEQA